MDTEPRSILYVNPVSKMAGAEFALLRLMVNLARDKWIPILLCREDGMFPQKCREEGIETHFLPTIPPGGTSVWDTYKTLLPNAWWIKQLISKKNIQLVHSNNPRAAYHGGLGARLAGAKSVMHVRDINNLPFQPDYKSRFFDTIVDRIIPVSFATKREITRLTSRLNQKISVVYDGVDRPPAHREEGKVGIRREFGIKEGDKLLCAIGRITPWKGYDIIINAFYQVRRENPDTHLMIVGEAWGGDEDFLKSLMELTSGLDMERFVTFTGFRKDIEEILSAIDFLIHSPTEPDPLPNILIEAGLMGKPVIAADIGGINEIVIDGETGLLFPSGDENSLVKAMNRLCNNPEMVMRLGEAAQDRAEEVFSIHQHVLKIEEIYEQLLDS